MPGHYVFDGDKIDWQSIEDPTQDYPCKYEMAILGSDAETGRLDLIVRWPPNSYCHFHRHVADTAIMVLEGEQHVVEIHDDGSEGQHKVRPAGTYVMSRGGEAHMEYGGPEGATVFFSLYAGQGPCFETLDRDMNILEASTVAEMAATPTLGER
ncbi:MAG: hypothetical protein AAGC67_19200 [Myxococcota bacterium]